MENNNSISHDDNVEVENQEQKPRMRTLSQKDYEALSFCRKKKKKLTPSILDTPMNERTYWGNDKGTDIEIAFTRIEIRRSLSKGEMLDIKNCRSAARLSKDIVCELMKYQLDLMISIADENECNVFANINRDGFIMIDFDEENNRYNLIEVK